MSAVPVSAPLSPFEQLRFGREIIRQEGQALLALSSRLDGEFNRAVETVLQCAGSVIVTGMGKAGIVGQKLAATLSSTGTPAHFLHPGEAVHGDLGRVQLRDVVLLLSQSGETEEIVRLLRALPDVPTIAVTGRPLSTLGRRATVTLDLGTLEEACSLGLAPSTSTTAMMALGDALALVVSRQRAFRPEDFARFHPAGSLGRKLAKVDDILRPIGQCRVASETQSVRDVFVGLCRPGRRTGAIMLTNESGKLVGIFTDSDLARLFENRRGDAMDRPIREVMTASPTTVLLGTRLPDAIELLSRRKISELPVVDAQGMPAGLIDITDVVAYLPQTAPPEGSPAVTIPIR